MSSCKHKQFDETVSAQEVDDTCTQEGTGSLLEILILFLEMLE
jgi:hypothetical protein